MTNIKNLKFPKPFSDQNGWPWESESSAEVYKDFKDIPKISIVTPSFNQGKYIEQTIRSVLLQNYPNLEYIIIDGGSTDNSVEIIKKYEKWITYWVSENDNGQTEAINKGLTKCTGEIFNWLNSDDYYEKDCFQNILKNYSRTETDVLAGNYRLFYENKTKNKDKIVDLSLRNTLEETLALVIVNQPSTFFKLDIVKELGGLNNTLHFVMDQDLWKKYLFKYGQDKVKIVNEKLANFRIHQDSKTSNNKFLDEYVNIFYSITLKTGMTKHAEILMKIYNFKEEKNYSFEMKFTNEITEIGKKVINSLIFSNARLAYTSGDYGLLIECLSVLDNKYLNSDQIKFANKLKIKSKLIKFNLKPIIKLINKTNSRARLKLSKEIS